MGLAGVQLMLGGNPVGVNAAVVLYGTFVFAVGVPVGATTLGVWLLGRRRSGRPQAPTNMAIVQDRSGPAIDTTAHPECNILRAGSGPD